ncbi:MAG: hypothetical protein JNM59_02520 [Hyphomonadaceae bacterium]|nr:hypothetical protein [Hyphomonadaceae bacterium]
MLELDAALAQVRNAWIAGRSALESAPSAWRDAVGEDELALIAIAGHAGDVLTQHAPGAALIDRPLLPRLAAPFVPEALRARFRRLLVRPKNQASLEQHLVAFITARGFAAHPGDWMPDAKDDWAPDLYAPWLDWIRADARAVAPSDDEISVENYDLWSWTERRRAVAELRGRDPVAALAVIAAKAGGEPAERRVRLIELMQIRLSEADAEFLESLAKDRSDRVRTMSRGYLARLGRAGDTTALAAELAEMMTFEKAGIINRRMRLRFASLKTAAQHQRRQELMQIVSLGALASTLGATELQLVEAPDWQLDELRAFIAMTAETGGDMAVRALLANIMRERETPLATLLPLTARLSVAERTALLPDLMQLDGHQFEASLEIVGDALGAVPLSALAASPSNNAIRANVEAAAGADDNMRRNAMAILEHILPRAGLLLDQAGAKALVVQVTSLGLSPAEPMLDMLHFNAALTPETTP